jgi:hypothetical protein
MEQSQLKQKFRVEYLKNGEQFYTLHTFKDTLREGRNEMRKTKELYKKNGLIYKFRVVEVWI